uniref:Uncharacterized protein n=1 Tax=Magallana gigas TaxID=29159 RepID=K1PPQ2_MAGGI
MATSILRRLHDFITLRKLSVGMYRTKVKKTERRSKGKGTDNISRTRQNFAQIHKEPNWRETYTKVKNKQFLRRKTMRFELTTQDSQGQNIFIGFANVKRLMEELQTLNPALTVYYQQHKAILLHYPDGTEGSTLEEAARLINKEIDKATCKNVPDIFVNDIEDFQRGKHLVFHLKTQNKKLWSLLLGRIGIHFNQVAKYVKKVADLEGIDPSLYLRIIKKRGSPYDGIILWSNGDIDDEIFERAVSVINKNIDWLENLSDMVVKDINDMKRGIVLWSDEDIDDEKFEKAVSVVDKEICRVDKFLDMFVSDIQHMQRSQHRVFQFETDDQEPWAILLAKHGINFDRVAQRIKKVDSSLRVHVIRDGNYSHKGIVLWSTEQTGIDDEKFEEAASIINHEREKVEKFFDMFISDTEDLESGKHRVFNFESGSIQTWEILLCFSGSNFDKVAQQVKEIDSSLHLKIFTPEDYNYEGVILWSNENIDDEKFEEAASIVNGHIRDIKKSLKTNAFVMMAQNVRVGCKVISKIQCPQVFVM